MRTKTERYIAAYERLMICLIDPTRQQVDKVQCWRKMQSLTNSILQGLEGI